MMNPKTKAIQLGMTVLLSGAIYTFVLMPLLVLLSLVTRFADKATPPAWVGRYNQAIVALSFVAAIAIIRFSWLRCTRDTNRQAPQQQNACD